MKREKFFEILCDEEMLKIRGGEDNGIGNDKDQQGMPVPPVPPPGIDEENISFSVMIVSAAQPAIENANKEHENNGNHYGQGTI